MSVWCRRATLGMEVAQVEPAGTGGWLVGTREPGATLGFPTWAMERMVVFFFECSCFNEKWHGNIQRYLLKEGDNTIYPRLGHNFPVPKLPTTTHCYEWYHCLEWGLPLFFIFMGFYALQMPPTMGAWLINNLPTGYKKLELVTTQTL